MANRNRDDSGFMLLGEREEPFEAPNYRAQIKHDGRRVQVEKRGDSVIMRGRDNIVSDRYPEVVEALRKIPHDFKIDTEFAVFEDEFKTDRGKLQSRDRTKDRFKIKLMSKVMPVQPAIFDLLEIDGNDMRNEPYERRKQKLQEAFSGVEGVRVVKDYDDPLEAWEIAQKHKLEGIVERDVTKPYIEGRTDAAVKVKRKRIWLKEFDGYEENPAGITLTDSKEGLRCACHGKQHHKVKEQIDKFGSAKVYVRAMADITDNGKLREIVFYKLKR